MEQMRTLLGRPFCPSCHRHMRKGHIEKLDMDIWVCACGKTYLAEIKQDTPAPTVKKKRNLKVRTVKES